MCFDKDMKILAFLRIYKIRMSERYNVPMAVFLKDKYIGTFKSASDAYEKTQHLEKRDWENGKVQDVWFQWDFTGEVDLFSK